MLAVFTLAATVVAAPIPLPERAAITGQVTDSAGAPIPRAIIVIEEAHRSTTADREGRFRLPDVPPGVYGVSFRAIGYRPRVMRVTVGDRDVVLEVALEESVVELPPIQATATPLATAALDAPQPLTVMQGADLARAQAASLGNVLEGTPGVRAQTTGNGIAKPVIRGLTGTRVLVLDNGQRAETQQWGDEHAPNVETAAAERIEVVRGPASVLYGSDALGGVINVVSRELPDAHGGSAFVAGRLNAGWSSNGSAPEGAALVEGAAGGVGFRVTGSGRSSDDIRAPDGALSNSGLAMGAGSIALGVRGGRGAITGNYSRRVERLEIHEDPEEDPLATPFQRVSTDRAALTGNLSLGGARLELDLGWEANRRREFESVEAEAADDLELGLRSATWTGNIHLHHAAHHRMSGILGVQGLATDVTTSGEELLVPATRTRNLALYGFEQVDLGRVQLAIGARVDRRTLDNDAASTLGVVAGSRDWTAFSGNAGALLRVGDEAALVLNLGRGFRAPSAFELFANGVHEGTRRYEVGDPSLDTERSFNVDLAFRVQSSRVQAEVGVFNNRIAGYIRPDPTGEVDPESGLPIYRMRQANATLRGFEAAAQVHPIAAIHLKAGADFTRGSLDRTGAPLPGIPPLRVHGSVGWEGEALLGLDAPWVEVGVTTHAHQGRRDPEDVSPPGYTLATLAGGAALGRATITAEVGNLFDVRYRGFLSRYKRYADEQGRNLGVRVSYEL